MPIKLKQALFHTPWLAFQVVGDYVDNWEEFEEWELQPLSGGTLAEKDVGEPLDGLFIIAAQIVSGRGTPQRCYLAVTLPERISEEHFVEENGRIARREGRRTTEGKVIPSIGIEHLGNYMLYFAKEDPLAGINILRSGMAPARQKEYLACDLGYLLRDQKMYEEAIEAFSIVLANTPEQSIVPYIYRERSLLYAATGRLKEAEEDKKRSGI